MLEIRPDDEDSEHRSGSWKVAYADFVTALMALFIVLWLISSGREVREAVSGYFRDPRGYRTLSGSAHAGSGEGLAVDKSNIGQLQKKLQQALRDLPGFHKFSEYVSVSVTGEGLRIELLEKDTGLFFETGSPRPTENGRRLFDLLAQQLSSMPNTVAIEGHTDSRPFRSQGAEAYGNWELSFDRANMARRVMLGAGLRAEQIAEIRGYADRHILITSDPTDSRNRRISVIMKYEGQ